MRDFLRERDVPRLLVKICVKVSSFILGALMLIVFGCIIFTIVQHTWNSMAILFVMEVFLILIAAGTGVIEGALEIASESLGGLYEIIRMDRMEINVLLTNAGV